jgi:hypothetical protein
MTPSKQKAIEYINKYYHLFSVELENTINYREAKECALILIDEKLNTLKGLEDSVWHNNTKLFLEKVKEEIYLS